MPLLVHLGTPILRYGLYHLVDGSAFDYKPAYAPFHGWPKDDKRPCNSDERPIFDRFHGFREIQRKLPEPCLLYSYKRIVFHQILLRIKAWLHVTVEFIRSGCNQHSRYILDRAGYLDGTVISHFVHYVQPSHSFHCTYYCTYHFLLSTD